MCVDQVVDEDAARHGKRLHPELKKGVTRSHFRPTVGVLLTTLKSGPGGAGTPRGPAETYEGGHDDASLRHPGDGVRCTTPTRWESDR
jgi:hypothetical protein